MIIKFKIKHGITSSSDTEGPDTETEAPLSQEGYACMKMINPNLSDEINGLLKVEPDCEPPRDLYLPTLAVPDEGPPRESFCKN